MFQIEYIWTRCIDLKKYLKNCLSYEIILNKKKLNYENI